MCETPRDKAETDESVKENAEEKSYYYDDAHGYEDFDPETEEADEDLDESA